MRSKEISAIAWALLGTFAFSLLLALGRLFGKSAEIPALETVFFRYLSGFATMIILSSRNSFTDVQWKGFAWFRGHLFRALCGSAGVVCSLFAASNMPFADASAIGLTQGMLVVFLAAIFLHERLTLTQLLASLACVVGACVVVFGKSGFHLPAKEYAVPAMVGLLGSLLVAGEIILIRTLATRDSANTVLLYVNLLACLFLIFPAVLTWQQVTFMDGIKFAALGPLAIAAGSDWI